MLNPAPTNPSQPSFSNDGRSRTLQRCTYTGNIDKEGLQRHKSTTGAKAGQNVLAPGSRLLPAPYWSPPQYPVGSTGIIGAIENDGHNIACLGIEINDKNPVIEKEDQVRDDWRYIPGDAVLIIGKSHTITASEPVRIISGGSEITIEPGGVVRIRTEVLEIVAPTTNITGDVSIGGAVDISGTLDSRGTTTVDGVEVALMGAVDNKGDRIVDTKQGGLPGLPI